MSLRIREKQEIASGIFRFVLARADGGGLPPFTPGSHIEIRAPGGVINKYSLCGDCSDASFYEIAVKREAGGAGGSFSLTQDANIGGMLEVGQPHNDFPLAPNIQNFLFIAGGIGVTPIISMMRYLKSSGAGRFKLYYLTREPAATAFLEDLKESQYRGQVVFHHDGGDPEKALDLWPILEKPQGRHLYCCGPRPLMEAVRDMSGHWSSAAVHFEDFNASAAHKPQDKPFRVTLARSGKTLEIPADVSILDALRAEGMEISSSCESGSCGTCRTKLLSGDVDHRDLVLTEREHSTDIMICVSRAREDGGNSSDLVLDL